jgi:hypothetical protein
MKTCSEDRLKEWVGKLQQGFYFGDFNGKDINSIYAGVIDNVIREVEFSGNLSAKEAEEVSINLGKINNRTWQYQESQFLRGCLGLKEVVTNPAALIAAYFAF